MIRHVHSFAEDIDAMIWNVETCVPDNLIFRKEVILHHGYICNHGRDYGYYCGHGHGPDHD